jgi:hypothetical protein
LTILKYEASGHDAVERRPDRFEGTVKARQECAPNRHQTRRDDAARHDNHQKRRLPFVLRQQPSRDR